VWYNKGTPHPFIPAHIKLRQLHLIANHKSIIDIKIKCAMPSAAQRDPLQLPEWERPATTTHRVAWADIAVIDISTFEEPGEKERLAEQLRHAVKRLVI
jgi:hypothetical protein